MPRSTGEHWMGAPEAANYLGVTLRTLYSFIDQGQLPAYKLGRVIRLKVEDIEAFLESRRIPPGSLRHLYPPYTADEARHWSQDHGGELPIGAMTVSVAEAADMLDISRSTAFKRSRRGELLPGVQVLPIAPRLSRVSRAQIRRYFATRGAGLKQAGDPGSV